MIRQVIQRQLYILYYTIRISKSVQVLNPIVKGLCFTKWLVKTSHISNITQKIYSISKWVIKELHCVNKILPLANVCYNFTTTSRIHHIPFCGTVCADICCKIMKYTAMINQYEPDIFRERLRKTNSSSDIASIFKSRFPPICQNVASKYFLL